MYGGVGNSNKRKRQDQGNQKEEVADGGPPSSLRQFALGNRLDESFSTQGFAQPSLNQQQQLLQGSFPMQPNIASEGLLSAGNYPLLNPSATAFRNLPLPGNVNRGSDPFAANSFLPSASQPSLSGYLDPSFSSQTGLLGQGLWANEATQVQVHAQVQAQAHAQQAQAQAQARAQQVQAQQAQAQAQLQAQLQAQAQLQVQAQAQTQAGMFTSPQSQRGLLMGELTGFPNVASQHSSQLPNLPISVGQPSASLAMPSDSRFPSAHQQQVPTSTRGASSTKDLSTSNLVGSKNDLTGRPPVVLYMPCDDAVISRYQCVARQQMELFEAQEIDVEAGAQGRNRGIVLGQVGIRCRHCSHLYPRRRTKSSTFYPSKLKSIYQTAQNMANTHLTHTCQYIPQEIRDQLLKLSQDKKTSAGGGKEYWSDGARILGVYEAETYLRFNQSNDYPGSMRPADENSGV